MINHRKLRYQLSWPLNDGAILRLSTSGAYFGKKHWVPTISPLFNFRKICGLQIGDDILSQKVDTPSFRVSWLWFDGASMEPQNWKSVLMFRWPSGHQTWQWFIISPFIVKLPWWGCPINFPSPAASRQCPGGDGDVTNLAGANCVRWDIYIYITIHMYISRWGHK